MEPPDRTILFSANAPFSHRSRCKSWETVMLDSRDGIWGMTSAPPARGRALVREETAASLRPSPTAGCTASGTDKSTGHNSTPVREGGREGGGRERE